MDDKTKAVMLIGAGTILVMGCALNIRTRQLKDLSKASRKLVAWSELAQRVMTESFEKHPDLATTFSPDLVTDISFFTIAVKEKLD